MTVNTGSSASQQMPPKPEARGEPAGLGDRYREIGILAVAAAVRYAGTGKNPAYAPAAVVPNANQRAHEHAV